MLTPEQIEARTKAVGCSELLAAAGKDPRCSRLELYKRKKGEIARPAVDEEEDRIRFGNLLEPVIRNEVARRLKTEIVVPEKSMIHLSAPIVGHPDGLFVPASVRQGLEIKTCDKFEADEFGEEHTDQVPVRYLVQCQGYMSITGAETWQLAVLIGGNELRMYEIARDQSLIEALEYTARSFWRHVERSEPPDPTTPEDVKLRWPRDNGKLVKATPEVQDQVLELVEVRREYKALETRKAELEAQIKTYMGENAQLLGLDNTLLCTWRKAKDGRKLDDKLLALEQPDIWNKYQKPTLGSRRFLVKIDESTGD